MYNNYINAGFIMNGLSYTKGQRIVALEVFQDYQLEKDVPEKLHHAWIAGQHFANDPKIARALLNKQISTIAFFIFAIVGALLLAGSAYSYGAEHLQTAKDLVITASCSLGLAIIAGGAWKYWKGRLEAELVAYNKQSEERCHLREHHRHLEAMPATQHNDYLKAISKETTNCDREGCLVCRDIWDRCTGKGVGE